MRLFKFIGPSQCFGHFPSGDQGVGIKNRSSEYQKFKYYSAWETTSNREGSKTRSCSAEVNRNSYRLPVHFSFTLWD